VVACKGVVRMRVGCEVFAAHGAGSSEHEDQQSRRCRAPIEDFAAARPPIEGGVPPQWSWAGKRTRGMFGMVWGGEMVRV